jgi:hypothetical protein
MLSLLHLHMDGFLKEGTAIFARRICGTEEYSAISPVVQRDRSVERTLA